MHPFEKQSTDVPPEVSSHLDVRLKPSWRFDGRRCALVSDVGESISLRDMLPTGTRIVPMVPSLADADPHTLSEDEHLLARCLQVVLPSAVDLPKLALALRNLDAVELVSTPPQVSLP